MLEIIPLGLLVLYVATFVYDFRQRHAQPVLAAASVVLKLLVAVAVFLVLRYANTTAYDDVVQSGGDGLGDIAGSVIITFGAMVLLASGFILDLVLAARSRRQKALTANGSA